jgi:hypothetical protein
MASCHRANIFIFSLHQSIFIKEKYQKKASPQDSFQTKPLGEYIQQQDNLNHVVSKFLNTNHNRDGIGRYWQGPWSPPPMTMKKKLKVKKKVR